MAPLAGPDPLQTVERLVELGSRGPAQEQAAGLGVAPQLLALSRSSPRCRPRAPSGEPRPPTRPAPARTGCRRPAAPTAAASAAADSMTWKSARTARPRLVLNDLGEAVGRPPPPCARRPATSAACDGRSAMQRPHLLEVAGSVRLRCATATRLLRVVDQRVDACGPAARGRPGTSARPGRRSPTISPPSSATRSQSARAVPPVASRSSWTAPGRRGERVGVHLERVDARTRARTRR